jgi:hypothetical protein
MRLITVEAVACLPTVHNSPAPLATWPEGYEKRAFARPCLDWTEHKYHLAGSLGAALLDQMLAKNWLRRKPNERTVVLTGKGEKALQELGIELHY